MKLRKLSYFIDVVNLRSITKAAKKNNITQCAMSQQMKSIEETMDALLLIRTKNEVLPTKAGLIFYAFCEECLERHHIYRKKIEKISNENLA